MAKKNKSEEDVCSGFKINGVLYPTEEIPEFEVIRIIKAMNEMLKGKEIFIESIKAG